MKSVERSWSSDENIFISCNELAQIILGAQNFIELELFFKKYLYTEWGQTCNNHK